MWGERLNITGSSSDVAQIFTHFTLKASSILAFLHVPKPHTNEFYIPRQCMYILYVFLKGLS